MVDLPQLPGGVPTVQTPQSSVSAGDVRAEANAWAGVSQSASEAIDEAAEPWAKTAAAATVTRNVDPQTGQSVIQVSPSLPVFGRLGDVFAATQRQVYDAQFRSSSEADMAVMRAKFSTPVDQGGYGGDINLLNQAMRAYGSQRVQNQPPAFMQLGRQIIDQLTGQYAASAAEEKVRNDGVLAKEALDSRIGQLRMNMADLAEQGKADSPEFKQMAEELDSRLKAKVADPRMLFTKQQADAEREIYASQISAQAILGQARRYYDSTGNLLEAQRMAEANLNKIPMDPAKRFQMLGEVSKHLAMRDAYHGQEVAELTSNAKALGDTILKTSKYDEVQVEELADKLVQAHAFKAAEDLKSIVRHEKMLPIIQSGTPEQASEALTSAQSKIGEPIQIQSGKVFATGYSPQLNGDKIEGDYHSSIAGPDGTTISRTLEDVRIGRSQYVTLAGNPSLYGKQYIIPQVTYQRDGQTYTLKNVPAVVHDTGSAFKDAPEGRFDISIARDLNMQDRNQSMANTQFIPVTGGANLPATKMLIDLNQHAYNERIKQAWGVATQAWDKNLQPTPQVLHEVATMLPNLSDDKLRQEISQRLTVEAAADKVSAIPLDARKELMEGLRLGAQTGKANGVAIQTLQRIDQRYAADKVMSQENPVGYVLKQTPDGAIGKATNIQPLDLTNPDAVAQGIKARQTLVGTGRKLDPSIGIKPLSPGDIGDITTALRTYPAQNSGAILETMNKSLTQGEMAEVMKDDGLKTAIRGMTQSGDPHKMEAAFNFLHGLEDKNPTLGVEQMFGKEMYRDMRNWQSATRFKSPEDAAREIQTYNDPTATAAREELRKRADTELAAVPPEKVTSKIFGSYMPFMSPGTPVSDQIYGSSAAMHADYAAAYRDARERNQDPVMADKTATDEIRKSWGVSAANNGRVMKNPPEMKMPLINGSPQTINGGYDWIKEQLEEDIAGALKLRGPMTLLTNVPGKTDYKQSRADNSPQGRSEDPYPSAPTIQKAVSNHYLVPDNQTQEDILAGRNPSYRVVVENANTGSLEVLTTAPNSSEFMRFRPDYNQAMAKEHSAALRENRTVRDVRSLNQSLSEIGVPGL